MTLEPLREAHAAELFETLSDPRLYRFIPQDPPVSIDALAARYARLESRTSPSGDEAWLNWAVRVRSTGRCVGTIQATVPRGEDAAGSVEAGGAHDHVAPDTRGGAASGGAVPGGAASGDLVSGDVVSGAQGHVAPGAATLRRAHIAYEIGVDHQGQGFATEACRRVIHALFADWAVHEVLADVDTRNDASIRLLTRLGFQPGDLRRDADFFKGASSDECRFTLPRSG